MCGCVKGGVGRTSSDPCATPCDAESRPRSEPVASAPPTTSVCTSAHNTIPRIAAGHAMPPCITHTVAGVVFFAAEGTESVNSILRESGSDSLVSNRRTKTLCVQYMTSGPCLKVAFD